MISMDTNLLLPAMVPGHADHQGAAGFIGEMSRRDDVAISEFILLELYGLLRNPVVLERPLGAAAAAAACRRFREHPRWRLVGLPPDGRRFHDELWAMLDMAGSARRRAYDLRVGLSLVRMGVTEFATVNVRDFEGVGFARVWNPLREG